eukprot:11042106-Ditylum_brightwellii.AAC.1
MKYLSHKDNPELREITAIPMVPGTHSQSTEALGGHGQHIIFVLDQSGSMQHSWPGVVAAYNGYITRLRQNQRYSDLVSVVQFDSAAMVTVEKKSISNVPSALGYGGRGTSFLPAAARACALAMSTPSTHTPSIVFMSDGEAGDANEAATRFSQLNNSFQGHIANANELDLNVIAFGSGASHEQLKKIASSSRNGKFQMSADTAELSNIFVQIADKGQVVNLLEAEIGKRISDAVSDRLALEYVR